MDIVERLRFYVGNHLYETHYSLESALIEAANEIEQLRHEMERIADVSERWPNSLVSQINEIARAALKEGE